MIHVWWHFCVEAYHKVFRSDAEALFISIQRECALNACPCVIVECRDTDLLKTV